MITVLAYLAIMVGCVFAGVVLMGFIAQAGRNELEARYLAMLHRAWWSTDCQVALGMEYYASYGPVTGFDPLRDQQQQFMRAVDVDFEFALVLLS